MAVREPKSEIRNTCTALSAGVRNLMSDLWYLFQRFTWGSALDITLVALVFFALFQLVRGTQAVQLLRGVILLAVIILLLGNALTLPAFGWLVRNAIPALLVALPVIFQPELRRALERLGRAGSFLTGPAHPSATETAIVETVAACQRLAERKHGALVIFERETGLQDYIETGVQMNAEISSELLQTIFFPNTLLHDGAVIVRGDQVIAAACILPLTSGFLADRRLGLRHRAAIGITEATDAIAVVVSEERGSVSIAHNGRMIRRLDAQRLEAVLRAFYQPQLMRAVPFWSRRFVRPGSEAGARPAASPTSTRPGDSA
jgi:diadenylate cyclase